MKEFIPTTDVFIKGNIRKRFIASQTAEFLRINTAGITIAGGISSITTDTTTVALYITVTRTVTECAVVRLKTEEL